MKRPAWKKYFFRAGRFVMDFTFSIVFQNYALYPNMTVYENMAFPIDQTEAMTLGTKMVVMKDGIIQQADSAEEIYNHPANRFVAGFIGSPAMNFIRAEVGEDKGKTVLFMGVIHTGCKFYPEGMKARILQEHAKGKAVVLGVRPEDIYEYKDAVGKKFEKNIINIKGKIEIKEILSTEAFLYYTMDGITNTCF